MSRNSNTIEYLKIVVAYMGTFGALLIPIPVIGGLLYKFYGTDWWIYSCLAAAFLTLPLIYISLLTSHRLGTYFITKWGNK